MAVLPLVISPDPRLKTASKPVEAVTDEVRRQLEDMLETMYAEHGIGLAAVQVGIMKRMLVIDVEQREEDGKRTPMKFINPEIIWESEELSSYNEGCLSFPSHYADVERPAEVKVKYLDEKGVQKEIHAKGLLATCLQHEIDHINGVTFVDHISRVKRDIILRKLAKDKKLGVVPEKRGENPYAAKEKQAEL
ncbi:MAG: peptide deformylase [Alphaproteobacteria bacterium]|nr:peptide deformylase [Alphaproteobacteria bacterium]